MRCSAHCPPAGGGRLAAAVIGAAAAVAAVAGISAVLGDIVLGAAILAGILLVLGVCTLAWALRRPAVELYRPQSPATLAPSQSHQLAASSPAAISTARRHAAITGLILGAAGPGRPTGSPSATTARSSPRPGSQDGR